MTPAQVAAMRNPTVPRWSWTPTALVALQPEIVRRVILADIYALRAWASPLPPGVRL